MEWSLRHNYEWRYYLSTFTFLVIVLAIVDFLWCLFFKSDTSFAREAVWVILLAFFLTLWEGSLFSLELEKKGMRFQAPSDLSRYLKAGFVSDMGPGQLSVFLSKKLGKERKVKWLDDSSIRINEARFWTYGGYSLGYLLIYPTRHDSVGFTYGMKLKHPLLPGLNYIRTRSLYFASYIVKSIKGDYV